MWPVDMFSWPSQPAGDAGPGQAAGAWPARHGVTDTNAVPGQKEPLITSTVSSPVLVA